ncbi:MAG: TenA family protein [Thermoplasmata archaeon]|nr:TenA family protein [Thermoplasmata archaeon]
MKFSDYLIEKSKEIWKEFLPNKFLREIAEDKIKKEAFEKWLSNDYNFVKNALRFMNIISAKIPDKLIPFMTESICYIKEELKMFEEKAKEMKINLNNKVSFICQSYSNFLISSAFIHTFFENLAIYYCEEKAYYEAWNWVKKHVKNNSYKKFVEHWSSEDFRLYVEKIEEILNEFANQAGEYEKKEAEKLFIETSKFEKLFWDMAYE